MTKEQRIINYLQEEIPTFDLIQLHNAYCQATNNYDDEIYDNDMFDEIMNGLEPWNIACKIQFGDFNPFYEFFKFNGYGNIQSIAKYDLDRYIDVVDLANYIVENDSDLGYSDGWNCCHDILCILSNGDLEEPENE